MIRKNRILCLFLSALICVLHAHASSDISRKNLVKNPDFQSGLDSWNKMDPSGQLKASAEERNGRKALKMSYEAPAKVGWPMLVQDVDLAPGKTYTVSVDIDAENTRGGTGPYFVIEYLNAAGKRSGLSNGEALILKPGTWTTGKVTIRVPSAAAKMRINLILHGHGTAWFSAVKVTEFTPPENGSLPKEVNARIASQPKPHRLVGIGFEDDGYTYTEANVKHGEDEASLLLREARIRWLKPGFVRMFVWMGEWLPGGFFTTATPAGYLWDSDLMKSKIRSLQQYQALGTQVNLTGVEWGGPYIKNEMWCDVNAWVMAQWAKDPAQSEEALLNRYATTRMKLSDEDAKKFRRLCLLSADAVVRGRNSTHGDMSPWWTRDQGIGWPGVNKDKAAQTRNLKQKDESVAMWKEIIALAESIRWADTSTRDFAVASTRYGLGLFEIYRAVVYLADAEARNDPVALQSWIHVYDQAWRDYQKLPATHPATGTLYNPMYKLHIKNPAHDKVNALRKK